ncbi:MAG TPA: hypothetical protein VIM64_11560 [Puia sp.]
MRRKLSQNIDYPAGTLKSVRRFAWWPADIGSFKVWMEHYEELYVFRIEVIGGIVNGEPVKVIKKFWDKVEQRII